MNGYEINNLPSNLDNNAYVVCTYVDGELWYYGNYATIEKAIEVATDDEDRLVIR